VYYVHLFVYVCMFVCLSVLTKMVKKYEYIGGVLGTFRGHAHSE